MHAMTNRTGELEPAIACGASGELDGAMAHAVLAASPDCVIVLSAEGRIQFLNDRCLELKEIAAVETVLGQYFFDIWPESERPKIAAAIRRAAAGETASAEGFGPTAMGNPRWWEVRFAPIQIPGGPPRIVAISRDISERHAVEQALRDTEARLQLTLSNAQIVGFWDWHIREDTVFADTRFARLFNVDPDHAAAGAPIAAFTDAIHPDDRERVRAFITRGLETGEPFAEEYRLRGVDGVVRHVLAHGQCVYDADRQPSRFPGIVVDITEQREAEIALRDSENALRASERDLRLTLQAGRFGTWSRNLVSGEMTMSPLCRMLFGQDAQRDFTYGDLIAAVHPDDRERMTAAVASSVATGQDYTIDYRIVTKAGQLRWVALRGQPAYDVDGTPLRLIGIASDITDQKRAEAHRVALVDLADRFQDSDDAAEVSFMAAEILGRTLGVTRAGYGTIDLDAETISIERDWNRPGSMSIAGVLKFREYGSYIDDLKRGETVVFANAETDPRTVATAAALSAIDAMSVVNMPVREQGGLVALLFLNNKVAREWTEDELGFIREVAERTRLAVERRRAQQALRALAGSLERQVEERTVALQASEARLRQSQKMEAVGQLTGGVAHDFNNLLTGITGSLEILESRLAQGRLRELDRYITAAQGAAKRAAALTHRLLAFSRQQTLEPKVTRPDRLIADMEELIRRTMGPSITVEVVGTAGPWRTLVDQNQLENALLNLCINARDAMPGGGRLTVETSNKWLDDRAAQDRDLPPGQYLSLCVSDTGEGMRAEVIERAFDPFFTTKPIGAGTGLGLSMVYGFVRQSGGQVRIYSEPGEGAMVCLYLPRHFGDDETPEETAPLARAAPRADDGQTVLVVDDEPTVRMLVTEVLEDLGYTVIEAIDGASGLKLLQSDRRVDLLVTDVGLPGGMNGRQLADAARDSRPQLKVLFITGYAENAVVGNGHLHPGMHVLTKPFPMETLASRVKAIIAER
jgi:PAS domain S-box-containing protein